jgi:exopolysaccharide biosynthesis WecB/TagA/CpsF family protein
MTPIRIRTFYPADPVGVVPGGVDTFLRGLIKFAPADLSFTLVGMTTDPQARPVGQWTRCHIGEREFDMHPVCAVRDAGTRGRIPLSVRFMAGVNRDRLALANDFDVFDFHRIEPMLMWRSDQRAKNIFFHQDPRFVRLSSSDNLWRRLPRVYERLERTAMEDASSAWCVRESGVVALRERYPSLREAIRFVPTWVDDEVFNLVGEERRAALRQQLCDLYRLPLDEPWLVSVGRLDTQKDPLLMVEAFGRLLSQGSRAHWIVVGDGVLRSEMQNLLNKAGISSHVSFLGLQPPSAVADILRASDGYVLSSAYEGMPMALLEGMGCGLPVVATDVGEVRRVVRDGVNGRIVKHGDAQGFAAALSELLTHREHWGGAMAQQSAAAFTPARVLTPVYNAYRVLGQPLARVRASAEAPRTHGLPQRLRRRVVGAPVDVIRPADACSRLLTWAARRESRYVCFVNVHSAIQATTDERHRVVLSAADLNAPDGAPIAWTLRAKGNREQRRVDGPDTMWSLLHQASQRGVSVGLYGSTQKTIQSLSLALVSAFPGLRIDYAYSPPFRELTPLEDQQVCEDIANSGIGLLFVGLGCPKQEFWMAEHRGRLPCVMLGVGAAFEFHAGQVQRAPGWMRNWGLEWTHRLMAQPGRLWRRYAYTNSLFVALSAREALISLMAWLRPRPGVRSR